jgi:hypothetical protein
MKWHMTLNLFLEEKMKKELSLGIGLLFFLLWVLMDGLGCSPLQLSTGFEAPIDNSG